MHLPINHSLYRILFAALLLVSQFSLAAHQIDYAHHDGTPCAVCIAAHGFDHAIPPTPHLISINASSESPVASAPLPVLSRTPVLQTARSPPVVSPH